MRAQIIKCKTCGQVIAACSEKYLDSDWFKSCISYSKTDNVVIETIETDGNIFGDKPLNNCCGKKVKVSQQVSNQTTTQS